MLYYSTCHLEHLVRGPCIGGSLVVGGVAVTVSLDGGLVNASGLRRPARRMPEVWLLLPSIRFWERRRYSRVNVAVINTYYIQSPSDSESCLIAKKDFIWYICEWSCQATTQRYMQLLTSAKPRSPSPLPLRYLYLPGLFQYSERSSMLP